ncbi:MAG: methyltransferase domain-containing protein [Myxococcota bacterium]
MGELAAPSPFFVAQAARIGEAARSGPLLDLACGPGRHALAAATRGARVVGLDRKLPALAELRAAALGRRLALETVCTDLEGGAGIPVRAGACAVILVFRFLFRPLAGAIQLALRPGGLLVYETFTTEQTRLGWGPSNPAYLLRRGELRELFAPLEVLEYWEGVRSGERPEAVAHLLARRRR